MLLRSFAHSKRLTKTWAERDGVATKNCMSRGGLAIISKLLVSSAPPPRASSAPFSSLMSTSPTSSDGAKRVKGCTTANNAAVEKTSINLNSHGAQAHTFATFADKRKLRKTPQHLPLRQVISHQSSNTCYFQIYGTGFDTGDTVPTVLLFFDQLRIIFNVGEGIQRFCTEHRIKMAKIDHIFCTRVCSETAGGLPGLLLTLAGINERGMTAQIWGPGDLSKLVNAIRSFVPNASTVYTHSFSGGGDMKGDDSGASTPIVLLEEELVKISAVVLGERSTNASVIYICELPEILGKFDPQKALSKGLKPGWKYSKLQKGEDVVSDDGIRMVYPHDVLGPSSPGPILILVDCPDPSYVSSLMSITSMKPYYHGSGKSVSCVVHLSPSNVTNHKEYQEWMANFKGAQHIMAGWQGQNRGSPILTSSAKILSKLNLLCPEVFPITGFPSTKHEDCSHKQPFSEDANSVVAAENLLKFRFKPVAAFGFDRSAVPEAFSIQAAREDLARNCPQLSDARERLSQVWKRSNGGEALLSGDERQTLPKCLQKCSREEMEIVFLGTGSSQPSKYRNVSGIYIHLFKCGGILLDCGEGTYAQLIRRYGSTDAEEVLRNMKCIWISHIHADHHTGLPRILSARKKLLAQTAMAQDPILVVGPRQLNRFLDAYEVLEDLGMEFVECGQTTAASWAAAEASKIVDRSGEEVETALRQATLKHALHSMGLESLVSVPVVHCLNAHGVVLKSEARFDAEGNATPGWKISYSGDTRPCQELIQASKGATVLIHEATFDDSLPVEALMKNHSITQEAIDVGMSAGAYRIILTHFSQRYPKIPSFDGSYTSRTCVAFDMMSVNLADLPLLPRLVPALKLLFQDDILMDDEDELAA